MSLRLRVSAIVVHHGEEPPLSGTHGIGNIFFSGCNLRCGYCQNWQISHRRHGERLYTPEALALEMLRLQEQGVHHIGLVSPSHQARAVAEALRLAKAQGLGIPVVYNTNAFDTLDALRRLDGLVDIYLPDLKYADDAVAWRVSRCRDYVRRARAAILEMYRQVGNLPDREAETLARRGLIVRHLVLPGGLAGTEACLRFLAEEVSPDLWLSLMGQYNPRPLLASGHAHLLEPYPDLGRRLTAQEYQAAIALALELGFTRLWVQDLETAPDHGLPDFTQPEPFSWEGHGTRRQPLEHGGRQVPEEDARHGGCA